MKQTIGIAAAWVGATVLAIVIAAAGIASVRSQVTEAPTPLGSPSALAVAGSVAATTTTVSGPTTVLPGTTQPPDPSASSTTSTPSTSVPGSSSPSTTTPATTSPTSTSKNYSTAGGTVTINIANPNVGFVNAVPNAGWKVEVEDTGPEKVKVKFERNDESEEEIEFVATFENGDLKITIEDH